MCLRCGTYKIFFYSVLFPTAYALLMHQVVPSLEPETLWIQIPDGGFVGETNASACVRNTVHYSGVHPCRLSVTTHTYLQRGRTESAHLKYPEAGRHGCKLSRVGVVRRG
jgi:hypothetical protein